MILLVAVALLFRPSNAGFGNTPLAHLSDLLRVKCDALPYRSAYFGNRCYFAVTQEITLSEATTQCIAIFPGSKVEVDVPAKIFGAMMLAKSKFHAPNDSSGEKQAICSIDWGYKCGANSEQSSIIPGKCIASDDKVKNFGQAVTFCTSLNMEIPTIDNELENRMMREAITGSHGNAWIQSCGNFGAIALNGQKRSKLKWNRVKYYSKYDTCYRNVSAIGPGRNVRGFVCVLDFSAVMQKTSGYWGISVQSTSDSDVIYRHSSVCVADALNQFTPGVMRMLCETKRAPTPCNYHESNTEIFPAVSAIRCGSEFSKTCYTATSTTTRYEILGKGTVETQRGCEVLCDWNHKCTAFSFKDAGFSSSCVLLSFSSCEICSAPITIFLKKMTGCVGRTNLTAEFGVDPCIDEMVPSAFRGFANSDRQICDNRKDKMYIIRAIDSCGRRITLDNHGFNWIEKKGDMFRFRAEYSALHTATPIVAASCVRAGAKKCPCKPLKYLSTVQGYKTYPATTDRQNPCKPNPGGPSTLWFDAPWRGEWGGVPGFSFLAGPYSFATCKAGEWMVYWEKTIPWGNITMRVTALACSNG